MVRVASLLFVGGALAYEVDDRVFQNKKQAHAGFIRVRRENMGLFFEEQFQEPNFQRECVEEQCDYQEYLESIAQENLSNEEIELKWTSLFRKCYLPREIEVSIEEEEGSGSRVSTGYCYANGTRLCTQEWNNARCECKRGWRGTHCEGDIDECEEAEYDVCLGKNDHSSCKNTFGGYECQCDQGYFKVEGAANKYNYTCEDVDECSLQIDNCDLDEECINIPGSFECKERVIPCEGIMWDGECVPNCEDDKIFDDNTGTCVCPNGQQLNESGECELVTTVPPEPTPLTCPIGQELNDDGICTDIVTSTPTPLNCEVDPCSYNGGLGGCDHECHSNFGQSNACEYWCTCQPGYKLSCDGKSCAPV